MTSERICARICRATRDYSHYIQRAYDEPQLERKARNSGWDPAGTIIVSPRLPEGQLIEWMLAYLAGIQSGETTE